MKQKAEGIYHRFVNYEWNDIGEGLEKSILEAIETAIKEGQKLPMHNVSKSFTAEEVVNELEDCDTLDDAIMFFKEQMQQYMFDNVAFTNVLK